MRAVDILMTYWSSHWKDAVRQTEQSFRNHTAGELRAFERSLQARTRRTKVSPAPRRTAFDRQQYRR